MRLASLLDLLHQIEILLMRLFLPSFGILSQKINYSGEKQTGQCFEKRIYSNDPFKLNGGLTEYVFPSITIELRSFEVFSYSKQTFDLTRSGMDFEIGDFHLRVNRMQFKQNSYFGDDLPLTFPILILW
jgi:hypothetical protein